MWIVVMHVFHRRVLSGARFGVYADFLYEFPADGIVHGTVHHITALYMTFLQ